MPSEIDLWKSINYYPTSEIVYCHVTPLDHKMTSASVLYDEWVCGRRWDALAVIQLLMLECKRRGHPIDLDKLSEWAWAKEEPHD